MDPGIMEVLIKEREEGESENKLNEIQSKEFPASVNMFNLGIKKKRT